MTPELRGFLQRLLHQAINAGIHSTFWKMPLVWILILLAIMIGTAVYFKLY